MQKLKERQGREVPVKVVEDRGQRIIVHVRKHLTPPAQSYHLGLVFLG
jgi:hypothetical protein